MAVIDTTLASLTIVKSFPYRGAPEEFSNTYFFDGAKPATDASWKALADAVILEEKPCHAAATTIVRAIGHQAHDSVAVWEYDYAAGSGAIAGTFTPGVDDVKMPGDAACWIRWSTTQKTSKGKPIYLRSYFHGCYRTAVGSDVDLISADYQTALQEYGDDWIAGFSDADGVVHHRAGPHGAVGQVADTSDYITTRTLERRGKRP